MSTNYSQYLGTRKCCDLKVQGPQGPQGSTGPSAIGSMGYQGATGSQGYQGATGSQGYQGATGPQGSTGPAGGPQGATGAQGFIGATGAQGSIGATGAQGFIGATGATGAQGFIGATGATGAQGIIGATGPSQWISMNGLGGSTGGYTGIGYTGDVLIYGNLLVTGGIDPTYLALTPGPTGPQGFINPLWLDTNANLRSEQILLANSTTNTDITNTLTNTQIEIIDNDPLLPDPKSTTITSTSISVIAGVNELDTQITNQEVKVRNSNDLYSTLSPTAVSFLDTVTTGFISSLSATTLQLTEGSGNLDVTLSNTTLSLSDATGVGFTSSLTTQNLEMTNASVVGYDQRLFQVDALTDTQYPSLYMRDESGYRATLQGTQLALYNEGSGGTYVFQSNGTDLLISSGGNDRMLLSSGVAETYWGDFTIGTGANMCLNLGGIGNCRADIDIRAGEFSVGDLNSAGNNTKIIVNDPTPYIYLQANGSIEIDSQSGSTAIGDVNGNSNGTTISVDDATQIFQVKAGNGLQFTTSTIKYATNLRASNATLAINDTYAQTFNNTSLTATLPVVDGTNLGIQFLITNTNATALTVNSSSSQTIYSTIAGGATSRTLNTGHSQIFTAIFTTTGSTYGWSMI